MKIEVTTPTPPPAFKPRFPLLAKGRLSQNVFIFISEKSGINLEVPGGHFSDTLQSVLHDDTWEILPTGTKVTLTQE